MEQDFNTKKHRQLPCRLQEDTIKVGRIFTFIEPTVALDENGKRHEDMRHFQHPYWLDPHEFRTKELGT